MTNRNRVRLSKLSFGLAMALAAAPAFAQNTTSAVGGRIATGDGAPIAGAQVTITHVASGTVSNATTGEDGRYSARGLRVGGPYTVTVTKDGKVETREGVYLPLATTAVVDVKIGQPTTATLATVEVTGAAVTSEVFSATNMGAGSNINREQIESFASIQRNLQDYARLDPRLAQTDKERGEISVAGQNTRYNKITIDGVNTSDTFGLEANNLPTRRQPISIDAIEEVQVNVANYDVTQTGYTGANINAVTKSGTNDFSGSVILGYRDDDMVGKVDGNKFTGFTKDETWGATFGGPLIQDKLFFFLGYEKNTITAPGSSFGPAGSGASNEINNISQAEIAEIIDVAQSVWGIDAGNLDAPAASKDVAEDKLVKIDWNISEAHRMSVRYNKTEQSFLITPNSNSSNLSLSSHWYAQVNNFENTVGQLFSDWTENFSTELKVTTSEFYKAPINNSNLPTIAIDVGGASVWLGTEQFRHANLLETSTFGIYLGGNLFLGDHELKFGVDHESNDVFNMFVESSLGNYKFDSIEDFRNGLYSPDFRNTAGFTLRTSPTGDPRDAAADYTLNNTGLFLQDTWSVNYNLTLMFGLRADIAGVNEVPQYNALFDTVFGMRNDSTIDGNTLIQPRFGFNYTFDAERPTQLRGGIGLFQGAAANVWLANPYQNNGQAIAIYTRASGQTDTLEPGALPPGVVAGAGGVQDVDLLASDFEQPSVWKANLAFDHELPWWGMVASAELILLNTESGIHYEKLNLGNSTTGYDGRQLFWGSTDPSRFSNGRFNGGSPTGRDSRFRDVLLARNTNKGESVASTISLRKDMQAGSNWGWSLAYSYTDGTEVSPLTSSRAVSNWNGRAVFNPNEELSATSAYNIQDRVVGTLTYAPKWFGDHRTNFSVFFEGRSGKPYSWTFANDMNGDGQAGNDLLYIPSGPGDVLFTSAQDATDFWAYVDANSDLAGQMGNAARRNGSNTPWVNSFDVRISQEIPAFFEGHKAEVALDILNIGNMIDKDWGQIEEIFFQSSGGPVRSFVNFAGVDPATGKYIYSLVRNSAGEFTPEDFGLRDRRGESRWGAQVTFKYKF